MTTLNHDGKTFEIKKNNVIKVRCAIHNVIEDFIIEGILKELK